jgi:hypothetical protein
MRSRHAILAFCAISPCLAAPAPAVASSVELSAHASNGYRIEVTGSRRKVRLSARGPAGTATYVVPGRVTQRRIVANFGKRGMIDVAFRPGGRARIETPPNRCEGRPRVTRWGAFVGTIHFKGERGFTRLRVRHASGAIHKAPRWRCERRRVPLAEEDDGLVLFELADPRHRLEMGAFALDLGDGEGLSAFFAAQSERRGRMRIRRTVFEITEGEELTFDESLTRATIAPPPPFAGKGVFERRKGADSWTGTLSVVLPGTPRFSLIGKRLHPRLYRLSEDGIATFGI